MSMRTMACSSSNRNGQRLGQLGLADAGGAEEHERADRPVRILQAGARAAHRGSRPPAPPRPGRHALGEGIFHAQQLLALAFQHLVDRNAGPARDHLGDVIRRDGLLRPYRAIRSPAFGLQLLLPVRGCAIGKLAGLGQVALRWACSSSLRASSSFP
jgi:hypothetical protein